MARVPRHLHREAAVRGATRRRAAAVEPAEPEPADLRGLAPLLVRGHTETALPPDQRPWPVGAASMLALQRTHGNAAVGRLLPRQAPAAVRREPTAEATAYPNDTVVGTETLKTLGRTLYVLHGPRSHGIFNIPAVNTNAAQALKGFSVLEQNDRQAHLALKVVQVHKGGGADALKAVEGAKATIGARAKDEKGAYSRGAIEAYLSAVDAAKRDLGEIKAAQRAVKVVLMEMNVVLKKQAKVKQEDVVADATKLWDFEQQHIDDRKAIVDFFFDNAKDLMSPAKWAGLAEAAGMYLGRKFVKDRIGTAELESAQKELDAAKARLRKISDEILPAELDVVKEKVAGAIEAAQTAKENFLGRLDHLRRMEETVTETLSKSKDTRGAAVAITERGHVATAAFQAEEGLNLYLGQSGTYLEWLKKLDGLYRTLLAQLAKDPQYIALDQAHAAHLDAVARTNRETLGQVETWVVLSREEAQANLANLGKRDYMAGYDQITNVLHSALAGRNAPPEATKVKAE